MNWIKQQIGQPSTARGAAVLAAIGVIFPGLEGPLQQIAGGVAGLIALWDIVRVGRPWSAPGA